jgi:hypothetical protein
MTPWSRRTLAAAVVLEIVLLMAWSTNNECTDECNAVISRLAFFVGPVLLLIALIWAAVTIVQGWLRD